VVEIVKTDTPSIPTALTPYTIPLHGGSGGGTVVAVQSLVAPAVVIGVVAGIYGLVAERLLD
jgi:hypothetical protein